MNKRSKLPSLWLADLAGKSDEEGRAEIAREFSLDKLDESLIVLIGYISVGDYGCDSSAWFLLRRKGTNELFEAHGSHCSCYGFEGQWEPEPTTVEYLRSGKFSFSRGGYDGTPSAQQIADYIAEHIK